MVSIDTVYQRVLALANKEQRGYITPLEFNLLANQAQLEIFEQYFYDLNQFKRQPSESTTFSDMEELIGNKLSPFVTTTTVTLGTTFPSNYRIGRIFHNGYEVKRVDFNEINNIINSSFHSSGLLQNPVYRESATPGEDIEVFNGLGVSGQTTTGVTCEVISEPVKAEWTYNVIGEKALYNAGLVVNFQLHDSEETNLVIKILELAGIIIKQPDVVGIANQEEMQKIKQQKS
jgi:hypothetical protein